MYALNAHVRDTSHIVVHEVKLLLEGVLNMVSDFEVMNMSNVIRGCRAVSLPVCLSVCEDARLHRLEEALVSRTWVRLVGGR